MLVRHVEIFHNYKKTLTHTLCILEIMAPKWTDFVLTSNIPYSKTDILILNSFNIKP